MLQVAPAGKLEVVALLGRCSSHLPHRKPSTVTFAGTTLRKTWPRCVCAGACGWTAWDWHALHCASQALLIAPTGAVSVVMSVVRVAAHRVQDAPFSQSSPRRGLGPIGAVRCRSRVHQFSPPSHVGEALHAEWNLRSHGCSPVLRRGGGAKGSSVHAMLKETQLRSAHRSSLQVRGGRLCPDSGWQHAGTVGQPARDWRSARAT
jgi:hypothetical protein